MIALVLAAVLPVLCVPAVTVLAENISAVTVVIDAGHGGADGGVTGVNTGVKESDLNLAVSKLVGEYFESGGFRVVYTRSNKGGLYRETDGDKNVRICSAERR